MPTAAWQPTLIGSSVLLRPLTEADFEPLLAAASDPLIWEQHPERDRCERPQFSLYFRSGIQSGGALAIHDRASGKLIGSSRFTSYDPASSSIEVGYTFLIRSHWGTGHNRELKQLMLDHAFCFVETVFFYVGESNLRSQRALEKIGAMQMDRVSKARLSGGFSTSIVFRIQKADRRAGGAP